MIALKWSELEPFYVKILNIWNVFNEMKKIRFVLINGLTLLYGDDGFVLCFKTFIHD